ncbi:MAG: hypothetical protein LCH86_07610 [Proteobacteria bacterium]|nr:hypothetical protein [Pseudomonadota bacterium]
MMEHMVSDEQLAVLNADDDVRGRVAECVDEYAERGFWRSCSGCHELNDGAPTGQYSKAFKCHLGTGCGECGGIGAVWDATDYFDMTDAMLRGDIEIPSEIPEDIKETACDEGDAFSDWYGCDSDKRGRLTEAFERAIMAERLRGAAKGEPDPTLWVCFANNGNIRAWTPDKNRAELFRLDGLVMLPFIGPELDNLDAYGRAGIPSPETALAEEILAELVRARTKFPGKNVTFAALVEEVGELATATFEEGRDRVRKEAVQVAVMAMRMVLDGDHAFDAWRAGKGLDPLVTDEVRS